MIYKNKKAMVYSPDGDNGLFDIAIELLWFHGISTIVGYLKPNPLYTYILNVNDLSIHFVDNMFKRD